MKALRLSFLFAVGATLLGAPALFAEAKDNVSPPDAAAVRRAKPPGLLDGRMAERLGLTEEQKAKLAALRDKERAAVQAIRDDAALDQAQKREKIRASLKGARDEAATVLTDDQKAKLKQVRQRLQARAEHAGRARRLHEMARWHERQAGFGPRHGPGFPGPGPMMFGEGGRPGPRFGGRGPLPGGPMMPGFGFGEGRRPAPGPGFAAGLNLTPDQKSKADELRKRQQEKMAEIAKAGRDEFRALLTPEQQKEFDARHPAPPAKN